MSGELTIPAFLEQLRACALLDDAHLDELAACPEADGDSPNKLARVVFRRGWLTRFQLKTIAAGRGQDLTVGPYVLLDRIGEGGMGTVYKARHRHMQRIVALKMIRKEKLSNPNALRRFYQEMQLAAQLHHPNIVLAYDAGPAGNAHYFAMEYVEGISLSRLIIEQGPPPVARACDYIRQAALGLQHAHEKGLVHRDIKPGNLIVSRALAAAGGAAPRGDVVKLLDLGLARLQGGGGDTGVTRDGVVLGTPDYLAPEQAMNSHTVDIRADLYSLGCTFYFLLTGRPPFYGSALTELLIKHQMEKPAPLEQHDVKAPAGVEAILDRLLAKDPADRYQTPGELADDLAPYCSEGALGSETFRSLAARDVSGDGEWPTLVVEGKNEKANGEDDRTLVGEGTAERPRPQRRRAAPAARRRKPPRKLIALGGAVALVALLLLAGILYVVFRRPPADQHTLAPTATIPAGGQKQDTPPRGNGSGATNGGAQPVRPTDRGGATRKEEKVPPVGPADPVRVVAGPGKVLLPAPENIRALALSPDGKRVAFGATGVRVWDVEDGRQSRDFENQVYIVRSLAWSPDGSRLLVGGARRAVLLDAKTGQELKSFDGLPTAVTAVAFSADGRHVLTGLEGVSRPADKDGKVVYDDAEVRRWDVQTGQQVGRYRGPTGPVLAATFSADGKHVLAAPGLPDDKALYAWELDRGDAPHTFPLPPAVQNRVFSPDGREFALLGTADQVLRVYDTATGKELRHSGPLPPAFCLCWSRDGRYLACGASYFQEKKIGGAIHLLDAATCKEVKRFTGGETAAIALDVGPGGRHVISSADHAGVRLWDEGAKPQPQ